MRPRTFPALLAATAMLLAGCTQPADESATTPEPPRPSTPAATTSPTGSFAFGAGGDLGANEDTDRGLALLDASDAEFFLALGDLDYDQTPSDEAWCAYVSERLPSKGPDFGFQLVAGNHEADTGQDGRISRFAACLGDRMGSEGRYGAQYSFTYPATRPLVKVLMLSPRLTVDGHTYDYGEGSADRAWLVEQIDRARSDGIPWLVAGMHYPCLSTGAAHPGCDSGAEVLNLLLAEEVDLVLNGHNHVYERSKQIRLGPDCPEVVPGRYDAGCVSDDGEDGRYGAGRGTVQVTSGRVGGRHQGLDPMDPDGRWMVVSGGSTTGWTHFAVSERSIRATYVSTGGPTQDSFVITR